MRNVIIGKLKHNGPRLCGHAQRYIFQIFSFFRNKFVGGHVRMFLKKTVTLVRH